MKNLNIILSAIFVFICFNANGQDIIWQKKIDNGLKKFEESSLLKFDFNNNLISGGYSDDSNNVITFYFAKYDSIGNQIWKTIYYNSSGSENRLTDFKLDKNGNIYVLANIKNALNGDVLIVKFDNNGKKLWEKVYDNGLNDFSSKINIDNFGNLFITGSSEGINTESDFFTIKYDLDGNQKWIKGYNSSDNKLDESFDIINDNIGGVYAIGHSLINDILTGTVIHYDKDGTELWVKNHKNINEKSVDLYEVYLENEFLYIKGLTRVESFNISFLVLKYDLQGNLIWKFEYERYKGLFNILSNVKFNSKNELILNGYITKGNVGVDTPLLLTLKLNDNGEILWKCETDIKDKSFLSIGGLEIDNNDNIYSAGWYLNSKDTNAFLIKISDDGLLKAKVFYDTTNVIECNVYNMIIDKDNNPIIGGTILEKNSTTNYDGLIVKYNPFNNVLESIFKPNTYISIYPNPTHHTLTIQLPPAYTIANLKIFNNNGSLVHSQLLYITNDIDVSSLPYGMYYAHIQSKDGMEVVKFVKE